MKASYPVILTPAGRGYVVFVPNLNINTEGGTLAEALDMARDAYAHQVPLKPGAGEFLARRAGEETEQKAQLLRKALETLGDPSGFSQTQREQYEALRRELSRGGQVYYLHNRVENIESTAGRLRQWLGEDVAIGIAHGKMAERELSSVMQQMADGEIQVLVCTTIIETGIDIPNVNTLIIEDADRLGLAQLHQIRGRIGRSARRAYAYLTYRPGKVLTEVASKRLSAIREYGTFGSGFRIAMRDLEIRGAGNLLGPEQSGYLMSVGYDMYLKLLNDAVLEQQGRGRDIRPDCSADLATSAHIPEKYVSSPRQRMDLYRRMAAIRTTEEASDLVDELTDRYGDPPKAVMALLDVALLRAAAAEVFITDITQNAGVAAFTLDSRVDVPSLMAGCTMPGYRSRLRLSAGEPPRLQLHLSPGEDALAAAGKLTEELRLKKEELGKAHEGGAT